MTAMIIYASVFTVLLTGTYVILNIADDKKIILSNNRRNILRNIGHTLGFSTFLYAILALSLLLGK